MIFYDKNPFGLGETPPLLGKKTKKKLVFFFKEIFGSGGTPPPPFGKTKKKADFFYCSPLASRSHVF